MLFTLLLLVNQAILSFNYFRIFSFCGKLQSYALKLPPQLQKEYQQLYFPTQIPVNLKLFLFPYCSTMLCFVSGKIIFLFKTDTWFLISYLLSCQVFDPFHLFLFKYNFENMLSLLEKLVQFNSYNHSLSERRNNFISGSLKPGCTLPHS